MLEESQQKRGEELPAFCSVHVDTYEFVWLGQAGVIGTTQRLLYETRGGPCQHGLIIAMCGSRVLSVE